MKNRSVLNSPRFLSLKKKKRQILRKKIFFLIFLFFLIFIGSSFLAKWEKLNIDNIQITGNKVVETKTIEEAVKEKIAGNYLWFFPKTNFIIYPQHEIEIDLRNKFKRIKEVFVNNRNIKNLEVFVTERTALYTYCGIVPPKLDNSENKLPDEEKCYFLDEGGYIFDEAPYFSGEVYLKFYGSVYKATAEDGNGPLGFYFYQANFGKLISLKETLERIGIKPVIFYIQDDGDIKIFLSSTTAQSGPFIIFKANDNFDKIVENLQSVLFTEPLQTEFKTKYSSLIKIDLRFGNKVYYKFK